MQHAHCRGEHPVDGPSGCGNEACRGRKLCMPDCLGCPDNFLAACRGRHPVDGPNGCGHEACRGHARCWCTCRGCPDAVVEEPAGFFGGRAGRDIVLYLACLAGPADPSERNDLRFLDELRERHGIPAEQIWRLLERQCTERSILATFADCVETVEPGQMLFAYFGGHGDSADGRAQWSLGSHGSTQGTDLAPLLARCRGEVFVVADSCHSGAFLHDLQDALEAADAWHPPRLTALSSTQASLSARTGWRLLELLIASAAADRTPRETARHVVEKLRTPEKRQRAQFWFCDGTRVGERTEQG